MNAIEMLHNRRSIGKLSAPAPDARQRDAIFTAALRAADHGNLKPWRFLVVEGDGLAALGQAYADAALEADPDLPEEVQDSYRRMPTRAPLVVVAIASCQEHPKVPESEQLISAGAAVQNMLNAAYALDVGAFWRTGPLAYHPGVMRRLGLGEHERIVGFLYLGTPAGTPADSKLLATDDFFKPWPR
ncbi:nitroreductase family protein [Marinimicrobium alkaliphilum]|uniref:nitroreductase family protein n=1 Tax=Marinimicrobium alkaliphilum TaxID=2202654 RepID=UPI000DBA8DBE|nr:nitroreductase [Marinimicrobium alkaliphilum]